MAAKEKGAAPAMGSARNRAGGGKTATAKGLRLRFCLVFVGLAVGPILFVGLFLGEAGYSTVTSLSQRFLDTRAQQVRDNVKAYFETITGELTLLGAIAGTGTLEPAQRAAALQSLFLRNNSYQDMYFLDHRGAVLEWFSRTAVTAMVDDVSFEEAPIFKVPAAMLRPHLGDIRIDPTIREPLVSLAIPFADPHTGGLRHILMVNIRFKPIWDLLAQMEHEEGVDAYVVDSAGRIVAHRNPTVAMRGAHIGVGEATNGGLLTAREVLSTEQRALVHDMTLRVVVEKELAVAHRFANRFLWTTVGICFVALAIAVFIFLLYERGVIAPLGRLLTRVDSLRKGGYPDSMKVGGYGEVGILADSFGKMIGELKSARKRVQKSMDSLEEKNTQLSVKIEELKASESRADAASRAKSEFLSSMSHELRTPLNAILGFSEVIESEAFGPVSNSKYLGYAKDINDSGQHLLALINDLLDISKIEAGGYELVEEEIDVSEIFRACVLLLKETAQKGVVTIDLDTPWRLPALRGDKRSMKQIVINLLSNAVKFTLPDGTVTIRAWVSPEGSFVIQIADTGTGISLEDIPKALSPFRQVNSKVKDNNEGTGLGLPLTKSLVELHGGSLDVHSEVDVGTTVTVRFPAERIVNLSENTRALGANDRATN